MQPTHPANLEISWNRGAPLTRAFQGPYAVALLATEGTSWAWPCLACSKARSAVVNLEEEALAARAR